jgi:hypothetical protein
MNDISKVQPPAGAKVFLIHFGNKPKEEQIKQPVIWGSDDKYLPYVTDKTYKGHAKPSSVTHWVYR